MKVLVVSHEWEALTPGGAQRSAGALANGLSAMQGLEVTLASTVRESPSELIGDATLHARPYREVLVQSETDFEFFSWIDPAYIEHWTDVLRDTAPDVVHLHHYYHVGVELPLLIRRLLPNTAIVMTLHEYLAICLQSGQMLDSQGHLCGRSSPEACAACVSWPIGQTYARADYIRAGLSAVDFFVTPSEFARDRYLGWGLDPDRVRVIPNVLDLAPRLTRSADSRPSDGLRLAFIGQHTPYKGVDVLMEAIQILQTRAPAAVASLSVFGGGSERFSEDFHQRISDFQSQAPDFVTFRGSYTQEGLAEILDESDAIVVPSIWWENSPVVIEEALARRVPVICSDIGGMAEKVRDGVDGWHFQAGNPAALAEVIVGLFRRESLDLPGMRRPLDMADVVGQHMMVYHEALTKASIRSGLL